MKIRFVLIFFLIFKNLKAKEIDYVDSLYREIYDEKSTFCISFETIKNFFNFSFKEIDSEKNIEDIHRFFYHKDFDYQNLGILGSPSKNLYKINLKKLGFYSGYNSYDIYDEKYLNPIFFDTKSPYVNLDIALARLGSFAGRVICSFNITPKINFGASYEILIGQKEFLTNDFLDKSDRNIISNSFSIFSSFLSETFSSFLNFFVINHRTRDYAGIYAIPNFSSISKSNKLFLDTINLRKNGFESVKDRISLLSDEYFYSQPETVDYKITLNLYNQLKISEKIKIFCDAQVSFSRNYFEYRNREKENTKDEVKQKLSDLNKENILKENLSNIGIFKFDDKEYLVSTEILNPKFEIGTKLNILKSNFKISYRFEYFQVKKKYGEIFIPNDDEFKKNFSENFLNFFFQKNLNILKNDSIYFDSEYLFKDLYKLYLGYKCDLFNFDIGYTINNPSFLQQEFNWYGRKWKNNFEKIQKGDFFLEFKFKNKYFLELNPFVSFSLIKNYVFFKERSLNSDEFLVYDKILKERKSIYLDQDYFNKNNNEKFRKELLDLNRVSICSPFQSEKIIDIGTIGMNFKFRLSNFRLYSYLVFAKEIFSTENLIRFPSFMATTSLMYGKDVNEIFSYVAGIEVHYKSSYKGDSYDVVIQQFYLQDHFEIYSYPILDIFFNFRINRFKMFIKWGHINEYLFKSKGFFSSPFYVGRRMSLDLGFKWNFFD